MTELLVAIIVGLTLALLGLALVLCRISAELERQPGCGEIPHKSGREIPHDD